MTDHQKEVLKRIAIPAGIFGVVALVFWYFYNRGKGAATKLSAAGAGIPVWQQASGGGNTETNGSPAYKDPSINNYYPQSAVTPTGPVGPWQGAQAGKDDRLSYNMPPIQPAPIPAPVKKSDCCTDCSEKVRFPDSPKTTIVDPDRAQASGVYESLDDYYRRIVEMQHNPARSDFLIN